MPWSLLFFLFAHLKKKAAEIVSFDTANDLLSACPKSSHHSDGYKIKGVSFSYIFKIYF
jgi:hypothetical protein